MNTILFPFQSFVSHNLSINSIIIYKTMNVKIT